MGTDQCWSYGCFEAWQSSQPERRASVESTAVTRPCLEKSVQPQHHSSVHCNNTLTRKRELLTFATKVPPVFKTCEVIFKAWNLNTMRCRFQTKKSEKKEETHCKQQLCLDVLVNIVQPGYWNHKKILKILSGHGLGKYFNFFSSKFRHLLFCRISLN